MNRSQIIVVVAAIMFGIGIYFLPHAPSEEKTDTGNSVDFESPADMMLHEKKMLPPALLAELEEHEKGWKNAELKDKESKFDSLISFSQKKLRKALLTAIYFEQKAEISNTLNEWEKAGENFYKAAHFVQDSMKMKVYDNAIRSYQKALQIDVAALNAKTKLGICYVEAGLDPMKGIGLLKEVLNKDSTNIEAHLHLGFFSITSSQFEKAVDRFKKVLALDSTYIPAYIYLGDTYVRMNNMPKAIESYNEYKSLVTDSVIKQNVEEYINQLKISSN